MKAKEKKLLRKTLIAFAALLFAYVLLQIVSTQILGKIYKDYLFTWEWEEELNKLDLDQLKLEFDKPDIVSVDSLTKEDGWTVISLSPVHAGDVVMSVSNTDTGETLCIIGYKVSLTGIITNHYTGNFTNYRVYHLNMVLLFASISILLWISFVSAQRNLRYSYQAIFYSGLAIWITLITILITVLWFREEVMTNTYYVIQGAAGNFMVYTFLPLMVFCIALSVSNISLIRHEGFRSRNALGIILSLVMVVGDFFALLLNSLFTSGSEKAFKIFNASTGIYNTIYAFLECFLIGSILCGTLAAKHEPKYDKDYLIILGCKVKEDGTLYPLIRGRVDRAIAFYKKQLEKTGKKAVFVPSGGQGSDESVSEAEAMKRYLLQQGIPEEQILAEDQSKNTLQNMRFSKKLIEERTQNAKVAFSTTNFHVFRSGIIARQNDFEPDGMGSPTKWYFWPNAYMREVIGMMAYKWKSLVLVMIPIILFLIVITLIY